MSEAPESGLVVAIPEAEVLVKDFRDRYDPSARLGVPAHVTVLYPFKPPSEISPEDVETLRGLFSREAPFDVQLPEFRVFPNVLYLAPEPARSFRHLTEVVFAHFPNTPPYAGQFAETTPHLTVAQIDDHDGLSKVVSDFRLQTDGRLPIQSRVKEVLLMVNASRFWEIRNRFPLGSEITG